MALDEDKAERFVLLQRSADLLLNELALLSEEALPAEQQKKIRKSVGEFWITGMEVRSFITQHASPELAARIQKLYSE